MKKKTETQPNEDRTLRDFLKSDPQIIAEGYRLVKLLSMQTGKVKMDRIFADIKQALERSNYQFDPKITSFLDEIEKEDRALAKKLEKTDFWITPSMPLDFLLNLLKISPRPKLTSRKIEEYFLKYYNVDNYSNLISMVKSWENSPYFAQRMKIINDARDAHTNHQYTLSIPTLIPQIEGLLSSLTEKLWDTQRNCLKKHYLKGTRIFITICPKASFTN